MVIVNNNNKQILSIDFYGMFTYLGLFYAKKVRIVLIYNQWNFLTSKRCIFTFFSAVVC